MPSYKGKWHLEAGYALDEHTISSVPDGAGGFLTVRTEMGHLVYDLKYGNKRLNSTKIARVMADWIHRKYKHYQINCLAAVPPSTTRTYQPVVAIAKKLSEMLSVEHSSKELQKTKSTRSLKDISDETTRRKELTGAFRASDAFKRKTVLVVDDLFRSGATATEVVRTIKAAGAREVLLLAATKTRVRR